MSELSIFDFSGRFFEISFTLGSAAFTFHTTLDSLELAHLGQ